MMPNRCESLLDLLAVKVCLCLFIYYMTTDSNIRLSEESRIFDSILKQEDVQFCPFLLIAHHEGSREFETVVTTLQ